MDLVPRQNGVRSQYETRMREKLKAELAAEIARPLIPDAKRIRSYD